MHHNNQEEEHGKKEISDLEDELLRKIDVPYFKNNPDYIDSWVRYYNAKKDVRILFLMKFKKISSDFHWLYVELARFFNRKEKPEISLMLLKNAKKLNVYDPNVIDEEIKKYKDISSVNENDVYHLLNPKNFYVLRKTWNAPVIKYFYKNELFLDEKGNEMSIEEYRYNIWVTEKKSSKVSTCTLQVSLKKRIDVKSELSDFRQIQGLHFFNRLIVKNRLCNNLFMSRLKKQFVDKLHSNNSLRSKKTQIVRYFKKDTRIQKFQRCSRTFECIKFYKCISGNINSYFMLYSILEKISLNVSSENGSYLYNRDEKLKMCTTKESLSISDFIFYKKENKLIVVTDKFLNGNLIFLLEITENLNLIYNKEMKFIPKLEKMSYKYLVLRYSFLLDFKNIFNLIANQKEDVLVYFYSLKILKIIRYFYDKGFVLKEIKLESFILTESFNICYLDVSLLVENYEVDNICYFNLIEQLNLYIKDKINVYKDNDISIIDSSIQELESKLLRSQTFDIKELLIKHRFEMLSILK